MFLARYIINFKKMHFFGVQIIQQINILNIIEIFILSNVMLFANVYKK